MPSGSRSGGGGSHFGSSSRSSGGSSRSSWGGGGSSWGSGRHHHHGGRHVHIYGGGGFISPFIAFGFFFLIIALVMLCFPANKDYLKEQKQMIEADYTYYQTLITNAEENPDLLIEDAIVRDVLYNEDIGGWYITYQFSMGGRTFGLNDDHYTFCIYKYDPATHDDPIGNGDPKGLYPIDSGDIFPIAVNTNNAYTQVRSVNMDYADTELEHDFEYVDICNRINAPNTQLPVGIGALVISISIFTIGIVLAVKRSKKQKAEEIANSGKPTAAGSATVFMNEKENKCDYCGCIIKAGETTCKRCGAARKK
ncbi:MAG: hypothetical protein IJW32_02860 [Clostridia bacterium]|nr:hypothetical protein [Clostridia bacterium]